MIPEQLTLTNFKRFEHLDIVFHHGITGITGDNGVGKSSIADAVLFALYGVSSGISTDFVVSSFAKERCEVYLRFRQGSDTYEILRTYSRSKQHTANLRCNGNVRADGVTQVEQEVCRILGMNARSFQNTRYARQKDLTAIADLAPAKRKEWFLRITGVADLNKGSQEILKKRADKLEMEKATLSGELAALSLQNPEEEIGKAISELSELAKKIESLQSVEADRVEARESMAVELNAIRDRISRHTSLKEKLDATNKEINALQTRLTQLTVSLASFPAPGPDELKCLEESVAKLPEARKHLESYSAKKIAVERLTAERTSVIESRDYILNTQMKRADANIEACKTAEADLKIVTGEVRGILGCDDISLSIEQMIANFTAEKTKDAVLIEAGIVSREAIAGDLSDRLDTLRKMGADGNCPVCQQHLGDHYADVERDYMARIGEMQYACDAMRSQLGEVKANLQETLAKVNPLAERARKLGAIITLRKSRDTEKASIEKELASRNERIATLTEKISAEKFDHEHYIHLTGVVSDLEADRERHGILIQQESNRVGTVTRISEVHALCDDKKKALLEIQAEVSNATVDPNEERAASDALRGMDTALQSLRSDLATSTERVRNTNDRVRKLREVSERVSSLQEQIGKMEETIETINLTRAAISDYVIYLVRTIRSRIEMDASSISSEITGGKYTRILFDDDFNIVVADGDHEYAIERFSGGEQDDVAVALRLAMSRYLDDLNGSSESTFLIFDEIFGSQDEKRRSNLLAALRSQKSWFPVIILISHIDGMQGEFDNTIVIQGNGPVSTVISGDT